MASIKSTEGSMLMKGKDMHGQNTNHPHRRLVREQVDGKCWRHAQI